MLGKKFIAPLVSNSAVPGAVELQEDPGFEADEVDDVRANRALATELEAKAAASTKPVPPPRLGIRRMLSEMPCETGFLHQLPIQPSGFRLIPSLLRSEKGFTARDYKLGAWRHRHHVAVSIIHRIPDVSVRGPNIHPTRPRAVVGRIRLTGVARPAQIPARRDRRRKLDCPHLLHLTALRRISRVPLTAFAVANTANPLR